MNAVSILSSVSKGNDFPVILVVLSFFDGCVFVSPVHVLFSVKTLVILHLFMCDSYTVVFCVE